MDSDQVRSYTEAISLCRRLISQLTEDENSAQECFRGEILKTYRNALEAAKERTETVRNRLQSIQSLQQ